jgi:hypothetical protein
VAGGFKDSKGWGEANIMQNGTVDLQHGTGMDGDLHPFVEAVNAAPSTGEIRQCIVRNLCKDLQSSGAKYNQSNLNRLTVHWSRHW